MNTRSLDMEIMIEVRGLSKAVHGPAGTLVILKEVYLNIFSGEAVAIVGPSGSGKTTLIGLLAGLDTPTAGQVLMNGSDIVALDEDGRARIRRRQIGFVFQNFQLLSNLTAVENVMLPLEIAGDPKARALSLAILERVGLAERVDHYPRQLSGGEQQRVAIARAFVSGPRLLFADEPTGNLDGRTGGRIIDLLFELNIEFGTTLVLVTHDDALARRCHRRIVLEDGAIVPEA